MSPHFLYWGYYFQIFQWDYSLGQMASCVQWKLKNRLHYSRVIASDKSDYHQLSSDLVNNLRERERKVQENSKILSLAGPTVNIDFPYVECIYISKTWNIIPKTELQLNETSCRQKIQVSSNLEQVVMSWFINKSLDELQTILYNK